MLDFLNANVESFLMKKAAVFLQLNTSDQIVKHLLQGAAKEALLWLKDDFGKSRSWRWGEAHRIRYWHPYESLPFLSDIYTVQYPSRGGSEDSIMINGYGPSLYVHGDTTFENYRGSIERYRMAIDLSDSGPIASGMDISHDWRNNRDWRQSAQHSWRSFCRKNKDCVTPITFHEFALTLSPTEDNIPHFDEL
eukprot:gene2656-5212_t